jgi:hypothetical protein
MISGACASCGKGLCARCAPELRRGEEALCRACQPSAAPDDRDLAEPLPFGGLLWLWCVKVALLPVLLAGFTAFAFFIRGKFVELFAHPGLMKRPQGMTPQKLQEAMERVLTMTAAMEVLLIVLLALSLALAWLFFTKRRLTPWLFSGMAVASLVFAIILAALTDDSGLGGNAGIGAAQGIVSSAYGLLWVPYWLTSKRVAATFTR